MQTSYWASTHVPVPHLSRDLTAVILFCLLGLTISVVLVSYLGADTVGEMLAQVP
jgi:hypothetical protein